jgi:acyl-CoA thioesterase FadM
LASISIDFLIPIKKYDRIEVRTKVYEIGNKSLKMRQDIFNHTTGQVASSSRSVMVNFNNSLGKTLPIPLKWREKIACFENDLTF